MGDRRRVDLTADSKDSLFLCPSDLNSGNFKKIKDGPVVALDFGAVCFLLPIFFYLAMHMSTDGFTWTIAQKIQYPYLKSVDTMLTMLAVSGYLAQVGPKGVRSAFIIASCVLTYTNIITKKGAFRILRLISSLGCIVILYGLAKPTIFSTYYLKLTQHLYLYDPFLFL